MGHWPLDWASNAYIRFSHALSGLGDGNDARLVSQAVGLVPLWGLGRSQIASNKGLRQAAGTDSVRLWTSPVCRLVRADESPRHIAKCREGRGFSPAAPGSTVERAFRP
jgi:hypothetical protein